MNLEHGRGFVAVVEHGSIVAAATALGMSRPTLSRHLASLEASLGVALLHRTTRQVGPTEAGRRLYERLAPLFREASHIDRAFRRDAHEVTGRLTVSVAPVLAYELTDLLLVLQDEHPELSVVLQSTAERVDLREGPIDVALRAGALLDPHLTCRKLGRRRITAWASAGYLAARGTPASVDELSDHVLLRTLAPDGSPRRWWPLLEGGRVAVDGRFASDDQRALRHAAAAGRGICLLDAATAAAADLVPVLPEVGVEMELHAVFARRTLQPARLRAFLQAVVGWFSA